MGLRTLSMTGSKVVFTDEEGISTPRVRHKGRQPLIECVKRDFKIIYFPKSGEFLLLHYFIILLFFFQVNTGVALASTYPRVQ